MQKNKTALISESQRLMFETYADALIEWNKKINLTRIIERSNIWERHFYDSLTLMPHLPKGEFTLLDLGSGAGFPGAPIKIMRKDAYVTFLDARKKKLNFIAYIMQTLNLNGWEICHERAENFKGTYDVVTARSVARLDKLIKLALPLVKRGGVFLAMKGADAKEEAEFAKQKPQVIINSGILDHTIIKYEK